MAHFALIIDPDPHRRGQFLSSARQRLAVSWPHLVFEQREVGDLAISWALFPQAPQSWCSTEDAAGLVLGDAIQDDGCRLAATDLVRPAVNDSGRLPVCDGFYLLARLTGLRDMRLSADPLGLFPLYYWATPETLMAASSVHLATPRTSHSLEIDRFGLAALLSTNGLVGERTLQQGWRRLEPGCELRWRPGDAGHVTETYQLPIHGDYGALSFDEARQLVDERLSDAVRRHGPPQGESTVLLSGGLDSRLLAGYLTANELTGSATVWGRDSDFESRAATTVARVLGLPLVSEKREPSDTEFVRAAQVAAVWEQLSGGLSAVETIAAAPQLGQTARYCWGGYVGDITLGGTGVLSSWDSERRHPTFEQFLAATIDWGVPFHDLGQLIQGPNTHELVRDVREQLRRVWDVGNEPLTHRAVRMRLHLRVRCHIGAVLHRLSMHSWPLLPFIDRHLFDAVFNVNPHHVYERHLEHALLTSRFPNLARVAQDTNSFHFEPARYATRHPRSVWRHGMTSLRRLARTWYWKRWRGLEPRRYHRYFDPDGLYWSAVRRAAEPLRPTLVPWLNPNLLERHWPRPEVKLNCSNPFSGGGAMRLLIGLAFWMSGRDAPPLND